MVKPGYTYKAKIVKAYDGDTVTAEVNLGFSIKYTIKLRLLGINTPELRGSEREEGLKSRDYLRELILDKDVIVETKRDKKGKYGRYLAIIWLDDVNINEKLLNEGYAIEY